MLKNNKQRGTGLRLVPTQEAFQACFETTPLRPGLEGLNLYRWYLAQQYITNPLLVNGRKFGVRLWALMPGTQPLRGYLHKNGLVLFSSQPYKASGRDWDFHNNNNDSSISLQDRPAACRMALLSDMLTRILGHLQQSCLWNINET